MIKFNLNSKFVIKSKLTVRQVYALKELCEYDFKIIYQPGRSNPADRLSKHLDYYDTSEIKEAKCIRVLEFFSKFIDRLLESSKFKTLLNILEVIEFSKLRVERDK